MYWQFAVAIFHFLRQEIIMKTQDIDEDSMTAEEKLFVENVLTFYRETAKGADEVPDGKVIHAIDCKIAEGGKEFLAKIFESVLEGAVEKEAKEMDRSCPDCGTTMRNRGSKKRS